MSSNVLLQAFDEQWKAIRRQLAEMEAEIQRIARQERAEVAASVPVYANLGALPTAGQQGRLAAAGGKLYFDTGAVWREVTLV